MLKVIKFKNYYDECQWIGNQLLEKKSSRWIVPDLKTKDSFKKILHNQSKVLAESKVLRANEYWANLFVRNNTCLLYTSPSPRDRTRSRMPSSA